MLNILINKQKMLILEDWQDSKQTKGEQNDVNRDRKTDKPY